MSPPGANPFFTALFLNEALELMARPTMQVTCAAISALNLIKRQNLRQYSKPGITLLRQRQVEGLLEPRKDPEATAENHRNWANPKYRADCLPPKPETPGCFS